MCIEWKTVTTEGKKCSHDTIATVNSKENKCGRDRILKLDSEERESGDSVAVAITCTEIVSSLQACSNASDCKRVQKAPYCKNRPSLYLIALLLVMPCIAALKDISIGTTHSSAEMKEAMTLKPERDNVEVGRHTNNKIPAEKRTQER